MPRGLATPWTKGGQKQVEALTKGRESRAIKDLDTAKGIKGQLEATSISVPAKAGESGRLFGAVSNGDIADAVKAAGGPELDKRKIEVKSHIKTTGSYQATVRLHPEVSATITFDVVPA
jgi:large subunit ribosomal protein L9